LPARVDTALARVGLVAKADTTVTALSAGMRARLQLARAVLHRPALLLLDEPTASVDPVAAPGLLDLVRELVEDDGAAALISSHRLDEIPYLGGRVVLLDRGRVRHDGDVASLWTRWGRQELRIRFGDETTARAAADRIRGVSDGPVVVVPLPADGTVGALLVRLGELTAAVRELDHRPVPLLEILATAYEEEP
jgi:ABC-2 type transport system ATP-binding protein